MPGLQSQVHLKSLLSEYFQDLKSPLAWCTSAGPVEILRALGFRVYFPENHGALLGATRTANDYISVAQKAGYGTEVCSYLTADIGAWIKKETPLQKAYGMAAVPKPDLIVYNTNQCREVAEWFNYFGREFQCPVVGIHPPRHLEAIRVSDLDIVVKQFQNLIALGEKIIGHSLDPNALATVVGNSRIGSELWGDVLRTAMNHPSPLSFFDGCILMAPIVVLRGTEACNDFYLQTLTELRQLNSDGIPAVQDETVRLFWDGMPIWGRLRTLSEFFAERNTCIVASTYCNSWILDDLDADQPLESMAYAYTKMFINLGENAKVEYLKNMAKMYDIKGMIFHDSKTCFNNSNNRFGLPQRLRNETGVETLTIDGDLNDLRFYSDGQTRTKLETFIEQFIT